ncbi:putative alkaline shock family protein YloU [Keratinibaculum paraultunense]|uniref:Putative alkaline shock family protein YloU n=1 Tax=Keratinibaculum paraultunense TaxID=1278232 RepID=A0A4R3KWD1_9FIRM|nr:Asp23/Gls24 family envelope stress response protein [Keratinibaculum paraultunense]QQY80775.1 Asp23/Gls24 family envelope stress response protein [Keratinibaculum paraultunense]TCS89613.1 putative alkaline shock family protein YloU [Keratinibaculum paraultunense]
MPAKTKSEYGYITIEDSVIATIAGLSAMESYGIVGMASKNATDGFFELLKWENLAKGVKVYTKNDEVEVDLHVILEYGVRISVVAQNIIEKVKFNIENLTGLKVTKVNVFVQGIRVEK